MICCGSSVKSEIGEKALTQLKDNDSLKLSINLSGYNLNLDQGEWKTNLNNAPLHDDNSKKSEEKLNELKKEDSILDQQLIEKEKQLKLLVTEFLIMTKAHCQIKSDIQALFDEVGVAHD